jgi:hypothetical protein
MLRWASGFNRKTFDLDKLHIFATHIYITTCTRAQNSHISVSNKNRQHNGQMKKDKRTNTYLQDTIQKTKDRITRTPLKTGGELMCSRMVGSSYSTSDTCRFTLVKSPVLSHEWGMDREVHTTSDIQVFGDMMHIPFLCFGQFLDSVL